MVLNHAVVCLVIYMAFQRRRSVNTNIFMRREKFKVSLGLFMESLNEILIVASLNQSYGMTAISMIFMI